jgi:hypothetical protein
LVEESALGFGIIDNNFVFANDNRGNSMFAATKAEFFIMCLSY